MGFIMGAEDDEDCAGGGGDRGLLQQRLQMCRRGPQTLCGSTLNAVGEKHGL